MLFWGGASLLFLRAGANRSRRLLGGILLLNGLLYAFQLYSRLTGSMLFVSRDFFSPATLLIGVFFVFIILPYIIEVMRPGWITWKRAGLLFLTYLCLLLCYLVPVALLGKPVAKLTGPADFWAHAGEFNVWFRPVIFLVEMGYLITMHSLVFRYQAKYRKWCREQYSSSEQMGITWLHYFELGLYGILCNYLLLMFVGTSAIFVVHQFLGITVFSFALYHGLFHENPYPEGFFRNTMNEEQAEAAEWPPTAAKVVEIKEDTFVEKLPLYKVTVQEWMKRERPYLRVDFKLVDVTVVLPLNRSYLSRVFNEGFGTSFSQLVQTYRLEEAKRLLFEETDIPVSQIIVNSGFRSATSFHRSFLNAYGCTPKQMRNGKASRGLTMVFFTFW